MKPKIRLGFCDFWDGFDLRCNRFTELLAPHYDLELTDEPDFLIYSCFGKQHREHRSMRIFYTGENRRPDFRTCDFAFTFDHLDHPDHVRLPLYALYFRSEQFLKRESFDPERVLASKTGFCNFVYSNRKAKQRIQFFEKLSKYRRVDSGGKVLNNLGGLVPDKMAFIRNYKFTIAFENTSYPGYTTEKIAEPMVAESMPIYWGNPCVERDFNPRSFLNYFDHGSDESLIERIIELDQNDDLYCAQLREPWLHENRISEYLDWNRVLEKFHEIFHTDRTPIARRRRKWYLLPPWRRAA